MQADEEEMATMKKEVTTEDLEMAIVKETEKDLKTKRTAEEGEEVGEEEEEEGST